MRKRQTMETEQRENTCVGTVRQNHPNEWDAICATKARFQVHVLHPLGHITANVKIDRGLLLIRTVGPDWILMAKTMYSVQKR